jgi:hypothetical protein
MTPLRADNARPRPLFVTKPTSARAARESSPDAIDGFLLREDAAKGSEAQATALGSRLRGNGGENGRTPRRRAGNDKW